MPELSSSEPQIVVPDCNVLIHGKALRSLPWEEWGQKAIEILIVGPVLGELDTVKTRPGRPGRIAREISPSPAMRKARAQSAVSVGPPSYADVRHQPLEMWSWPTR